MFEHKKSQLFENRTLIALASMAAVALLVSLEPTTLAGAKALALGGVIGEEGVLAAEATATTLSSIAAGASLISAGTVTPIAGAVVAGSAIGVL